MKRRILKREKNVIGFNFEGVTFQNIVVREETPVDQFYFEETIASDDNQKCVAFVDPIRMLFNQQRLSRIGSTAVDAWLTSMFNSKKDPLKELRKNCTDADLRDLIKSRHIQQPCELMAYAQWCQDNMETFKSEVSKLVAEKQAKEAETKANAETSASVEPSKSE